MSYNPALTTARDRLRAHLGDTDVANELLPDATYDAVLTTENQNEAKAELALARMLLARFSQMPDTFEIGGTRLSFKVLLSGWKAAIDRLAPATQSGTLTTLLPTRGDEETAEYYARRRDNW